MAMSLKKIVLKNKTSLSLNERFTFLRRQNERAPEVMMPAMGRGESMRQQRANIQRASAKNRRLALQMENRPAVAAALRIKKRNMRQRVGMATIQPQVNVRDRLTLSPRARLGWRGRMGTRGLVSRGRNNQRGNQQMRGRGQGQFRRGQGQQLRGGVLNTMRSAGNFRPQRGQNSRARGMTRGGFFPRGGRNNNNMQQANFAGGFNNRRGRGNFSPRMRGGARGRGGRGQQRGGRGGQPRGGRGARRQAPVPTKDELDNQLDEYMSST